MWMLWGEVLKLPQTDLPWGVARIPPPILRNFSEQATTNVPAGFWNSLQMLDFLEIRGRLLLPPFLGLHCELSEFQL